MKYRFIITAKAKAEIAGAVNWYEQQTAGLGRQFWRHLKACLLDIRKDPLRFRSISPKYRPAIVSQFPYLVFYRVKEDEIRILHVLHGARDLLALLDR